MEEEDLEIEDVFKKRPKKIKSGKKGKRVELDLIKSLNKRFSRILKENPSWGRLIRSLGSGETCPFSLGEFHRTIGLGM